MTWGLVAVAGATVATGYMGSRAADKAAGAQLGAAQEQSQVQREMFAEQNRLQEPFRQAGMTGQNELMRLLGLGGDAGSMGYGSAAQPFTNQDMYRDPGYGFRVSEGVKALDRSAAARGGLLGGNQLRGVTELGQNLGSQEYQNAFNRYQAERAARLNPLQSLAGQGQSAANTMTGAAGQYGQNQAAILGNAGNIRASGYVGQANALTGAIGQGISSYNNYQLMNRVFPQQTAQTRQFPTYGSPIDTNIYQTNDTQFG
jgi:hypothetical protein